MKTAIFIEDKRKQVILTPETETDKMIIKELASNKIVTAIKTGSFYQCQGGWARQDSSQDSLMIVMDEGEN